MISGYCDASAAKRRSSTASVDGESTLHSASTGSSSLLDAACHGRIRSPGPSSSALTWSATISSRAITPSSTSRPMWSALAPERRETSHGPTPSRWVLDEQPPLGVGAARLREQRAEVGVGLEQWDLFRPHGYGSKRGRRCCAARRAPVGRARSARPVVLTVPGRAVRCRSVRQSTKPARSTRCGSARRPCRPTIAASSVPTSDRRERDQRRRSRAPRRPPAATAG